MGNVRGLRDPRKRWVMHFELELEEGKVTPVMLCYEPGLGEQLNRLKARFEELGALTVSAWWERSGEIPTDIRLFVVLSKPWNGESVFELVLPLPVSEWDIAWGRTAAAGRHTVLVSITANPAVLRLEEDPTSWEVEVPVAEATVYRQTRESADWQG